MLNRLLLIIAILSFTSCIHQKIVPIEERQVQTVHEVNMSKDKIFDKTLEWMAVTFTDSKAVIEIKDKENGKIVGKGVASYADPAKFGMTMPCRFTMTVDIKDNKCRTTYNNFIDMVSINYHLQSEPELDSVKKSIANIDSSLTSFLSKTNNDNW